MANSKPHLTMCPDHPGVAASIAEFAPGVGIAKCRRVVLPSRVRVRIPGDWSAWLDLNQHQWIIDPLH